jgi:diguanylate cyclase (GGDEF)-like protein/PAS domain S-box-containing protein
MDMPVMLDPECQQALLDIHEALMAWDTDETSVLNGVCEKLAAYRPYRLVWAGLTGMDTGLAIRSVAGNVPRSLQGSILDLSHAGMDDAIARCVRTAQPVWLEKGLAGLKHASLEALPAADLAAPAALYPLTIQNRCIGVLCVVARMAQGLTQDDHLLLQMATQHIGFTLAMLRVFAARDAANEQLKLAAAVFDNSLEGIIVTDRNGTILAANTAACQATGYAVGELVGSNPRTFNSGRQSKAFYASMWETITHAGQWKGEIWNRRKNGEIYPEWLSISAVRDEQGEIANYIGIFIDISRQKEAERNLDYLAHHDTLTGLPNRMLFNDRLLVAIAKARRNHQALAVLFIDLDHFKYVNDTFGHSEGDFLLQAVARRLKGCLREEDTLSRMGGDEFTILLHDLDGQGAELVARKILEAMKLPFNLSEHRLYVTASIGISVYPDDGDEPASLLKNSDTAMYRAKEQGRDNMQFFRENMHEYSIRRVEMEQNMRQALEQEEFRVYYQPQIDLASGRMTGVEALLRWLSPETGLALPGQFIPLAEETGMIVAIGEWVLRAACRQCKAWHESGRHGLRVAVNLSARQFQQANLVGMVANVLRDTGLDPGCLELELTESIAMQNAEEAVATLNSLKQLGVQISIDDFGTGYSSLSYLKRFPIDKLKIDQSFVAGIAEDPNDAAIIIAVIALAHSLGLQVIAEGVETVEQLDFLKMHSCNEVQGYLFGRPMPAEALAGNPIFP